MPLIVFKLDDLPPSANHLFVNNPRTRGRFISKDYAAWRQKSELIIRRQIHAKLELPSKSIWEATYSINFHNWRSDLDNRLKAVNDLVCKVIGLDDRYQVAIKMNKTVDKNQPAGLIAQVLVTA